MTMQVLCGLRIQSDLPLPDLPAWRGAEGVPDVIVRLGEVPALADPVWHTAHMQVGADGTARLELEVASYCVDAAGREITVEPRMAPAAVDIRAFLYGTVFAILCFRRGLVPLHAAVVRIGDKAVAFSGDSGAGKSTMAAMFLKRGFAIVADDVAVTTVANRLVSVAPGPPRLKLWRDAMDGLSFATDGVETTRLQQDKFLLPVADFAAEPLPLATIYHLSEASAPPDEEMRPLAGINAFRAMERAVYRGGLGRRLLGRQALFTMAGAVADGLKSVLLKRIKTLARADAIVDEIVACEGMT